MADPKVVLSVPRWADKSAEQKAGHLVVQMVHLMVPLMAFQMAPLSVAWRAD